MGLALLYMLTLSAASQKRDGEDETGRVHTTTLIKLFKLMRKFNLVASNDLSCYDNIVSTSSSTPPFNCNKWLPLIINTPEIVCDS